MSTKTQTVTVLGVDFPDLLTEQRVLSGFRVVDLRHQSREEATAAARDAVAVMVDYFMCDEAFIRELRSCRVICQYGVGLDHVDVDAASAAGILVTHTPLYCVDELADHTVALLLAAVRKIPVYDRSVRAGVWDYNVGSPLLRLANAKVGMIGMGRVGQAVARRLSGFGVDLLAVDDVVDDETFENLSVTRCSFSDVISRCDVICLHVPLTEATKNLLNDDAFSQMKRGTIVVNTSRGGVIDVAALVKALDSGVVSFAALDVLDSEPPNVAHPLIGREDCVITPHAGFLSEESLRDLQEDAAEEVRLALTGGIPRFAVNADRTEEN